MSAADRTVVVIPCLNESRSIARLVRAVRGWIPTVLVVDDGSSDDTAAQAEAAGAQVLRHDSPRGKGAALQSAWDWGRQQGYTWALCMDGDGQHDPADIPAFLSAATATAGVAPLIIGNRMGQSGQMPTLRRWVNRIMSAWLSHLAGRKLPDTQCGYRLVALEELSCLQLCSNHFEIESEMVLAFAAAGHPLEFIPVAVIYRGEQSKIHPWRDTWRWMRWVRQSRHHSAAHRR